MAKREFYCTTCGLFHWKDNGLRVCPDEKCDSNIDGNISRIYAVDSMGFLYYYQSRIDEIKDLAWSSTQFSPQSAIDHYTKQGMTIK